MDTHAQSRSTRPQIKRLHHAAYRCQSSEDTRAFYEDFLELPLAGALKITQTKTGRQTEVLHTFYQLGDGSHLAFFEAPDQPFEFKSQHDFDLHIALEVDPTHLQHMLQKGKEQQIETRGPSDHGFIDSIYFRDPNGYVVELCAKKPGHDEHLKLNNTDAKKLLDQWNKASVK
ncbi:VOC family protein [Orrella daihaiensis]|uniref:VOC family protein n=1 Tax=Orrella daihaiensis TaxID=2782176 RepID=A0ABY4AL92_9BURK|nr:VOC family protein [Orrella daihaiensis]UOD50718.1 VOC family protein [Orrella daihaiensis]